MSEEKNKRIQKRIDFFQNWKNGNNQTDMEKGKKYYRQSQQLILDDQDTSQVIQSELKNLLNDPIIQKLNDLKIENPDQVSSKDLGFNKRKRAYSNDDKYKKFIKSSPKNKKNKEEIKKQEQDLELTSYLSCIEVFLEDSKKLDTINAFNTLFQQITDFDKNYENSEQIAKLRQCEQREQLGKSLADFFLKYFQKTINEEEGLTQSVELFDKIKLSNVFSNIQLKNLLLDCKAPVSKKVTQYKKDDENIFKKYFNFQGTITRRIEELGNKIETELEKETQQNNQENYELKKKKTVVKLRFTFSNSKNKPDEEPDNTKKTSSVTIRKKSS